MVQLFRENLLAGQRANGQNEPKLEGFDLDQINEGPNGSMTKDLYVRRDEEPPSLVRAEHRRYVSIDFRALRAEFDTERNVIEADWAEWLKKTSFQLLKQSPDPILYACSNVAEVYSPLASELYNVAFLALWRSLKDAEKDFIMQSINQAIRVKQGHKPQPRAVLQTILNLHEFMELDDGADDKDSRILDEKTLAEIAEECNAYAKALYYWEIEFQNDAKSTIEKIITTNYQLGQPEAAKGILVAAKRNHLIEKDEEHLFDTPEWLEKRHEWKGALDDYA